MLDVLITYGLPALLRHLEETKQKADLDEKASLQNQLRSLASAVRDVTDTDKKQAEITTGILKELQGLAPVNVNSQLEAIHEWMRDHIAAERRAHHRQLCWNIILATLAGISLFAVLVFTYYRWPR